MDWLTLLGGMIARVPVERVLLPPPDRTKELQKFLTTLPAPESAKGTAVAVKTTITPETPQEVAQGGPTGVVTRPGVDAERMAWQDGIIRGELWLLEGHLKNNCLGCGGDVECCWKHTKNVLDAARETQSMTTEPLYQEAVSTADLIQPFVHPLDVKAGKYRDRYPALAIEVARIRTQFDKRLMAHARPPVTLDEAKKMAAEQAARRVEEKWHSQNEK